MRGSLQHYHVIVKKIFYHNKESGYTVFEGLSLRWSARKKEYLPTKETHYYVGYLFCVFIDDHFEVEVSEIYSKTYGLQYAIIYSHRIEPGSLIEIRNFLQKNVKKLKPKHIEAILNRYGVDALTVLRKDKHAFDFLNLQCDSLSALQDELMHGAQFEEILIFLQLHTIEIHYAMPLYSFYKEETIHTLETNPYKPFFHNIYDFKIADNLYLSLGRQIDGMQRCVYAVLATLQYDCRNYGNVFSIRAELRKKMIEFMVGTLEIDMNFPFSDEDIASAIQYLSDADIIIEEEGAIYLK